LKQGKAFFFEKKKQKTFVSPWVARSCRGAKDIKVFWFFFKKERLA